MSAGTPVPDTPPLTLASLTDLTTFKLTRTLRLDKDVAHLLGTFKPRPAPAILTIRATKFTTALITSLIATLTSPTPTTTTNTTTTTQHLQQLTLRHANDIYYSFVLSATSASLPNHIDIICPCEQKHITFLSSSQPDTILIESPHHYATIHHPYIQQQLSSQHHLSWLYNILDGNSEQDRTILRTEQCVVVAQPEWDMHSLDSLHVLVLPTQRSGLTSLRALRSEHLPLLAAMREAVVGVLSSERYGVLSGESELLMYLHYPPSFYHLHVHVVHVTAAATVSSSVNKAVDLYEIEQHLEQNGSWYEKCDIRCRIRGGHALAQAMAPQQQDQQQPVKPAQST